MNSLVQLKNPQKEVFDSLFLHDKPVKMLISLKSDHIRYATQVSKHVDCTYSHTVKVLDMFKKLGLVDFEKKGRVKLIRLTNQGEEIAHDFEGISKKFLRLAREIEKLERQLRRQKKR